MPRFTRRLRTLCRSVAVTKALRDIEQEVFGIFLADGVSEFALTVHANLDPVVFVGVEALGELGRQRIVGFGFMVEPGVVRKIGIAPRLAKIAGQESP